MLSSSTQNGFTILELMVVIGLASMITAAGVLLISVSSSRADLEGQAVAIVDTLRRAQSHTMNGHNTDDYGVHLEAESYTLYKGTSYSPVDPNNITFDMPNRMEIRNISLNGAGSEVQFEDVFGNTATFGSFTVEDVQGAGVATVTVNEVGMIDVD